MEVAYRYKEKGNDKYRNGQHTDAYKLYQCAWRLFQVVVKDYPLAHKEIVLLLSNLSATCCQLKHGTDALDYAEQCLEADPSFVKVCRAHTHTHTHTHMHACMHVLSSPCIHTS